jgi:hypothetical protein
MLTSFSSKEKCLLQVLEGNVEQATKLEVVCKGQVISEPIYDTTAINQFILVLEEAIFYKDAPKFKSTLSYKLTNDSIWIVSLEFGGEYLKYKGKYYQNKDLINFTNKWFNIDMINDQDYYFCGKLSAK